MTSQPPTRPATAPGRSRLHTGAATSSPTGLRTGAATSSLTGARLRTWAATSSPTGARLSTWGLVWRYGLAIILGAGTVIAIAPVDGVASVVDVVLGVLSLFLIRWRYSRPVTLALVTTVFGLFSLSSVGFGMWAYVHLCTRRRAREIVPIALLYTLTQFLATWGPFRLTDSSVLNVDVSTADQAPDTLLAIALWFVVGLGMTALVTAWGLYIGARRDLIATLRERAETAEREQELQVLAGQAAERNRIAREMHDVLAHRMSLVSMHSGALAHREDLSPEQTREIARTIQENAHQSLTELRGVLGSLREDSSAGLPATPAKPQPTLADVATLIADARAAGDRIELEQAVDGEVPTRVGRHAYRIVQESLTNARKHAPHAVVHLSITGNAGEGLTIMARNPLGRSEAAARGVADGASFPSFVGANESDRTGPRTRTDAVTTDGARQGGSPSADRLLRNQAPGSGAEAGRRPGTLVPGSGAGLLGLAERAQMLGGTIEHGTTHEGWFELKVWLPW